MENNEETITLTLSRSRYNEILRIEDLNIDREKDCLFYYRTPGSQCLWSSGYVVQNPTSAIKEVNKLYEEVKNSLVRFERSNSEMKSHIQIIEAYNESMKDEIKWLKKNQSWFSRLFKKYDNRPFKSKRF